MNGNSKPTYEELVEGLQELLATHYDLGSGIPRIMPTRGYEEVLLRDAFGKARDLITRARDWQRRDLVVGRAVSGGAENELIEVRIGPEPTAEFLEDQVSQALEEAFKNYIDAQIKFAKERNGL